MATVIGVFSQHDQAEEAVRTLRDQGFRENEISIAAKDKGKNGGGNDGGSNRSDEYGMETGEENGMDANVGDGAAWGGALGGAAGLVASAGALAIPGIGPILAAGPLAAALSGAVAGGVAGGLIDMGIPEAEGKRFEQDLKSGKSLAIVKCDEDRAEKAGAILQESGANELKSFGSENGASHN